MSMMGALFGKSANGEQSSLVNLAHELSRCLPDSLVPGREEDKEVLLASLRECVAKVEQSGRPEDLESATVGMLEAYAVYNRETAAYLDDSRSKTDRLVELMNNTAGMGLRDAEETTTEVQAFEKELEQAVATNSLRSFHPRFKERLEKFRKRAENHREQLERTMTMSNALFPHLRPPKPVAEEAPAQPQEPQVQAAEIPAPSGETDPLTGLPMRQDAESMVARLIEAKTNAHLMAVVVDQMSMITHRYGNSIAEEVVLFYAQLLGQNLKPSEPMYCWNDRCFLCVLQRTDPKHLLRDQINWFLNTRYKRDTRIDTRSAMLNVGVSFKLWHISELRSEQHFAQTLDAHCGSSAA